MRSKQIFGCIGYPLAHSFSAKIHAKLTEAPYTLMPIAPDTLQAFMQAKAFSGINVTIPYKSAVLPYLDELSDEAKAIGAVNTILNRDGKLIGYNSDVHGFVALLQKSGVSVKDKKVAVLGTGGTSKTVCHVLRNMGADEILVVSRTPSDEQIGYQQLTDACKHIDIIINTTPVGMFPNSEEMPLALDAFSSLSAVIDVVYNPLSTKLVAKAREKGILAIGGLYMLVAQAVKAAEWFGYAECTDESIDAIYHNILQNMTNIVLIGMPSCGKSSVGQEIALKTGRTFYDVDQMIEAEVGISCADYIRLHGEATFREIESAMIDKLSLMSHAVIATGGGCVTRLCNMEKLKQNGFLYFLNKPLSMLFSSDDRPLTATPQQLSCIYAERFPLYQQYADRTISTSSTEIMVNFICQEIEQNKAKREWL